ncbi:MAG: hypothetical protein PHF81_08325 [Flavobacterium sp.]|nr:hypothetical protein [Flavobacterium sp.]
MRIPYLRLFFGALRILSRFEEVFSQPDVLAPCAVCDLRRRVFSAKRKYDKKW